mmetsp:Transcript_7726/g.22643  ORF Transcript_7726/g.22643 Transcript_7726/m.22643 type:complete len:200 (-) Transcript_7726:194-793(-)
MSLRSNSTPQTPLLTLVSKRSLPATRSSSFTSPLSYPAATTRLSALCASPNATAQQSRTGAPSSGSMDATGRSRWRGSQTWTAPSRPPVAISGAPAPFSPPHPSMQLMMASWPCVAMRGSCSRSRSQRATPPAKSPVARWRSAMDDAPNVPHLNAFGRSSSACSSMSPAVREYTWMSPVCRAGVPSETNRAEHGTHLVS